MSKLYWIENRNNKKIIHILGMKFSKKQFHSVCNMEINGALLIQPIIGFSNATIGKGSYVARNSCISYTDIGKYCSIGPNFLCGWGIHPTTGISTSPCFYSTHKQNGMTYSTTDKIEERKKITIGNDVFIGMNVTVLDGVTIGNGAVIGAGAVVVSDIPPYAVAVGVPAKIVKYRFSPEIIEKLEQIQWWNWEDDRIKDVERMFFNVEEFVRIYGEKE